MTERKPRRIFWFEGVTRTEVERSLSDTTPSRLRQQGPRRILVVAAALAITAMALMMFVTQTKIKSYGDIVCLTASLALYLSLRKAVRHVSDAPNELLDERQIALRDAAYTVAYRALAGLSLPYVALIGLITPDGLLAAHVASGTWWNLLMSYLMLCACLPAMVLAWQMPGERSEDSAC